MGKLLLFYLKSSMTWTKGELLKSNITLKRNHPSWCARFLLSSCQCLHSLKDELLCDNYGVWPHWAIYCTLGNFCKPVATIYLPQIATFLGNLLKVSKSFIFLVKSVLGHSLQTFGNFLLVTLTLNQEQEMMDSFQNGFQSNFQIFYNSFCRHCDFQSQNELHLFPSYKAILFGK